MKAQRLDLIKSAAVANWRAGYTRVARVERWTLAAVGLAAGALFAFAKLADEVMEGGTRAFDTALLLSLRTPGDPSDPIGPRWFEEMMRDFTALGGTGVLTILTLSVVIFLFMTGKRQSALAVMASISTGLLLSHALKWGFARPRPDLVPHGSFVYTGSFPSGHSMLSALVYLTLGTLLARTQGLRRVKVFLLSLAVFLTVLVGMSRVYLGVHWPTDVLAGWAGGAGWALFCRLVVLRLQRSREESLKALPPDPN